MSKRISVAAWTKNSFPSLTARRIVGPAAIRTALVRVLDCVETELKRRE